MATLTVLALWSKYGASGYSLAVLATRFFFVISSFFVTFQKAKLFVVNAATDPHSKTNRKQEVDIYYKGIGVLEMSKVFDTKQK